MNRNHIRKKIKSMDNEFWFVLMYKNTKSYTIFCQKQNVILQDDMVCLNRYEHGINNWKTNLSIPY